MSTKHPSRIPYTGFEALHEGLLPNPSETEIELEIKKQKILELRDRNKHLEQALGAAARLLAPYATKLNGGSR